jgi:hypothetical protein
VPLTSGAPNLRWDGANRLSQYPEQSLIVELQMRSDLRPQETWRRLVDQAVPRQQLGAGLRVTKTSLAAQPEGRVAFMFTPKHGSWINPISGIAVDFGLFTIFLPFKASNLKETSGGTKSEDARLPR